MIERDKDGRCVPSELVRGIVEIVADRVRTTGDKNLRRHIYEVCGAEIHTWDDAAVDTILFLEAWLTESRLPRMWPWSTLTHWCMDDQVDVAHIVKWLGLAIKIVEPEKSDPRKDESPTQLRLF